MMIFQISAKIDDFFMMIKGAHLASATVPWHWLFFCPAPKVRAYFEHPITKSLDSPKWHWLIFAPMGALDYILHSKDQKKALYGLWRAKMTLTNNTNTWYVFPTIVKNKHLGIY